MSGKKKGALPPKVESQRASIVERIVDDMGANGMLWCEPWKRLAAPRNPLSGTVYRGSNRFNLSVIAWMKGFDDPRWVTYLQAKEAGWTMLEKQKSPAVVENWKMIGIDDDEDGEDGKGGPSRAFPCCVGCWHVFNAAQFADAPPLGLRWADDGELGLMADRFVESSRCALVESLSDEACYRPRLDRVEVPLRSQFRSAGAFLSTLWHEMGHSTGHPDALDRQIDNRFGTEEYAREELVAELCSVFVAADMGVEAHVDEETAHYHNHVAYLQSWMQEIGDDPAVLFKAASAADKAARYLVERYDETPYRDLVA